jgi:hypothetical protein
MWVLGKKIRMVHIPRIQDAPQFFNGGKYVTCAPYIQSNMVFRELYADM